MCLKNIMVICEYSLIINRVMNNFGRMAPFTHSFNMLKDDSKVTILNSQRKVLGGRCSGHTYEELSLTEASQQQK